MGIPRFYRWLSERYPLVNENITAEQIPEFDNMYLDMNGIIHTSSHNNTGGLCVKDENDVFVEVFNYIVRLFTIIKPKKLLYMAVDGCAPRAKMNQQRSRRFRAANDAREARELAEENGEQIDAEPFDSNCITPGTAFMGALTEHLRFFVFKKIAEDPLWQGIDVILSGPDTPGEGEHKIMDYIRAAKAQPGYDPNLRHCLYGLDADLIMLSLASHEPHFALLREEVVFGRRATKKLEQRMIVSKDRFQLLHISLLREYLNLEFEPPRQAPLAFEYSIERVIDDFILFCMLVGNDFLPSLPLAEIGEGGLDRFFHAYKEHLKACSTSRPWLAGDCGEVHFDRLAMFLQRYAQVEHQDLEAAVEHGNWILGQRRIAGPKDAPEPASQGREGVVESPPNAEVARVQYYSIKFGMDTNTHAGTQARRALFHSYLEGLQWVMRYYFRGPGSASWSWYYPYYHAPMAADLASYDQLGDPNIHFDTGGPFRPFQQLMAVLPANSKTLLPECYQWLFDSPESPIRHFYPLRFVIDTDGVKVPWGGITLIPWIEPDALLGAMAEAERRGPPLTEAERKRNELRGAHCFRHDLGECLQVASSLPQRFTGLTDCPVHRRNFSHPSLPSDTAHFPNNLPPGCRLPASGFPFLHLHMLTCTFETGVKVLQFEARGESLFIHLHPKGSPIPTEANIQKFLKAKCVLMGYPMAHRGKVVAVHTSQTRFQADGARARNNPWAHENLVWRLTSEWRQRGLTVDFDGDAAEQALHQPVAEVKAIEATYLDAEGRVQHRLGATSEHCLLHLLRIADEPALAGPGALADRFPVGAPVLCIAGDSMAFGQMGVVLASAGDATALRASFRLGLTHEEQEALRQEIQKVVLKQQQTLHWWTLEQVAEYVNLGVRVTWQVFGSLMARDADNVREDLGMNLACEMWEGNVQVPFCLPSYSARWRGGWWFSDLAVEALQEYQQRFPGLFSALQSRRTDGRDLDMRLAFPDSDNADYAARQLVKYCNSQPFKKLSLSPEHYMVLAAPAVAEVVRAVDSAYKKLADRPVHAELVMGSHRVYRAEGVRSWLPRELRPAEGIALGQRGIYIGVNGPVPCGARGTVLGIHGIGAAQVLEMLLDEERFGATDLHGRTPSLRGLLAHPEDFMPVFDHATQEAAARATATAAAAESKDGPASETCQARSQGRAEGSEARGPARRPQGSGRKCNKMSRCKDGDTVGLAAGTEHALSAAAAPPGTPLPEASASPARQQSSGMAANGDSRASSRADESHWAQLFEELLSLAPKQIGKHIRGRPCSSTQTA